MTCAQISGYFDQYSHPSCYKRNAIPINSFRLLQSIQAHTRTHKYTHTHIHSVHIQIYIHMSVLVLVSIPI